MQYQDMTIQQLRKALDEKEVTSEELFTKANTLAHETQKDLNCFVTIIDKYKSKKKYDSVLTGIPYALKDNFSTANILTTASSNILKDYVPVYDATVYRKLKDAGAILVGKTVLDELAMGGTGTTGHTGVVCNPWDIKRQIGGSSAGSASCVAAGIVPFALGSDTGDSIRKPAAFGGIVGFKPTYGLISRYGLFAFASSLDHVGMFTRCVRDAAIVSDVLKGQDIHDMTSLKDDGKKLVDTLDQDITGKKLFYIEEICDKGQYENSNDKELLAVLDNFDSLLAKLEKKGFVIEKVSIDRYLLEAIYPTYMCISCAEATSNNANLTGIAFGPRGSGNSIEEVMFDARTKGFSELIKRRFVLGSYILQKENQEKLYLNACRVRRLLVDKLTTLFSQYDGMILPASGGVAPYFEDSSDKLSDRYLLLENHMALGNFGGFPSITIPCGMIEGLPIGVNITSSVLEDAKLLNIATKIEEVTGLKGLKAGDKNV